MFSNIKVSLWCIYYFHARVALQMASGGDLCHIGTGKLICEADRWTRSCAMWFLPEGPSEQTVILHLCGRAKYTSVLCFSIRGGDAHSVHWGNPSPSKTSPPFFLPNPALNWETVQAPPLGNPFVYIGFSRTPPLPPPPLKVGSFNELSKY